MSRLFAALLLTLVVSVLTGSSRFIDASGGGVLWIDVLFLTSAGIALTLGVLLIGERMRREAERDRERSDPPR
ncbi:MAG: hypothetical protein ACIARR_09980 [Phycisphaerales bacterium JB059]